MSGRPAVLVVDDDPSLRCWMERILGRHGYHAIAAADAVQGIAAYARDEVEIALAIVDMILPGDAGLDLAAELGRRHPGISILYISGCVGSIAMEAIARTSPELVLLKPFSEWSLIERVERLIPKGRGV